MDKKTVGIIATVATALICGCLGLGICLFGAITAAGEGTFNDSSLSPTVGFVMLCLSLIFFAIPVVVGVVTLRKPKETAPVVVDVEPAAKPPVEPSAEPKPPAPPVDDEPLPPAS